ncbi:uncharacterized protein RCO7_04776 [Rhynchosporium graminicola]|uniref:Uncharacterized protein n=2 Tax=Rhynchosporium TaxID=38037 RepID=A0A1E1M9P5_RHYSE|nr:uncharacterized protein RCO7_04776 [Rhynchosporium commune]CZT45822.1 uncharacterized protein RSE6_06177 [Rhynchosporium secalis]
MRFKNAFPTVVGFIGINAVNSTLVQIAELAEYCRTVSPNTYVAVYYQNIATPITYDFGQCYPYQLASGALAEVAVFCKTTTCYGNPNPDCTGGAVPPVPVPLVAGTPLPNLLDFVQLLGQGATCQRNGLS